MNGKVTGKIKTVLIFVLCLLPAVCSFAVSVRPPHSRAEWRPENEHPLAMHIHMVHLREFDLRQGKAIAKYEFHNAGKKPILIKNIKPSCGCIRVRMRGQGKAIQPEEQGEFYLEVDTTGESSGRHEYQVRIDYVQVGDEKKPLSENVLYRVEVPQKKITVRPNALIFYQLSSQETSQTIRLTDFRPGSSFHITNIQVDSEYLRAGEAVATKDQHGHLQYSIPVTAQATVPDGKHTGSIIIDTDDREFPQIRIPVLIFGPKQQVDAPKLPENGAN